MRLPQTVISLLTPLSSFYSPSNQQPSVVQSPLRHHPVTAGRSTFSPLLPPAIPLAVKSIYLNAWLPGGAGGYLAGTWPKHWPVNHPDSAKGFALSWAGLIRVDGHSFVFLGDPEVDDRGTRPPVATQLAFHYTASQSIFSFEAGGVPFNVTFLSPVTPHDFKRMSLPLSYLSVDVDPAALRKHNVSIYSDTSAEWASGDSSAEVVSLRTLERTGII